MEVASKLGAAPEKNPANVSDPCAQAACDRLVLLDHAGGDSSHRHGGDAVDEGVDPCPRVASGPALLLLQIGHDAPRTNLPSPMREGISGRSNRVARRALALFSSTASGREVKPPSAMLRRKSQDPNSKLQTNNKFQERPVLSRIWTLEFGYSLGFGNWDLEL